MTPNSCPWGCGDETPPHSTDLLWCHAGTLPIVQVILQVPVPDPELQLLQEGFVFHEIQCIEDVKSFLQREDMKTSVPDFVLGNSSYL